jgi:hypothetical protein
MASLRLWVVATGLNRDFPQLLFWPRSSERGFDCNATVRCKGSFRELLPKTLFSRDRNTFHVFLLLTACQVSNMSSVRGPEKAVFGPECEHWQPHPKLSCVIEWE